MRHLNRNLLTITTLTLGFIAAFACPAAFASTATTAAAIHTSPAEAKELSSPAVIAAATDPEAPAPSPTIDTPTLPPASASADGTDIEVDNTTAYPNRVQGMVVVRFHNDPNQTYDCSGTLVDSKQKNLVMTAGHCTWDTDTKAYPTAMVFIPGYHDGVEPYGEFPAVAANSTSKWVNTGSFSYDMGAFLLAGKPENRIGSRDIAFNLNPVNRKFKIYGYPAYPQPYYDGEKLIRCDASMQGRDGLGALAPMAGGPCYMEEGASGGGWITDGGYLNSMTSYIYCDNVPTKCGLVFGPYFSNQALALYKSVATTVTPTVKFIKPPPRVTSKRRIVVKLGGKGTTPLFNFSCKLDDRPFHDCYPNTVISLLAVGKHRLTVTSEDQTGNVSKRKVTRTFRVVKKK